MATVRHSATAAPQFSGYLFQLERALFHLATAADDAAVAVEYPDDVAVLRAGKATLLEQDKNSVTIGKDLLRNRSKNLWRTLQVWLETHEGPEGVTCAQYLLVTSTANRDSIVTTLKQHRSGAVSAADVVTVLRADSGPKSKAKVQAIIDDVLARPDTVLASLIAKIEIVESSSLEDNKAHLANALKIDPGVDSETVLDNLLGWITRLLRTLWQAEQPGIVERRACILQCRQTERMLIRQRLLPRPARDVTLENSDRERVRARPFVAHLDRVESDQDVVLEAIEQFLQFNIEKHRLTAQGEIPDREWIDRGERLRTRWRGVVRQVKLQLPGTSDVVQGQHVLSRSTTDHYEVLGGQTCEELYMTAGHYHRLADEDAVWWHPSFQKEI